MRIGQTRDVFIFNLSVKGTIEDHLLEILDGKINMFEMVTGEIEPILGYLEENKEFEEIFMAIRLGSRNPEEARSGFKALGHKMVKAKAASLESKEIAPASIRFEATIRTGFVSTGRRRVRNTFSSSTPTEDPR